MPNLAKKVGYIGSKWPILVILQVFPHNEAQIHSEWPFSCNSQLFPSFATKASHFIRNLKNLHFLGGGGRYIGKFFEFFNFLDSFHTKLAKNDPQWQIWPKKSVRLAQNGQFWSFCRFFPRISHNSVFFDFSNSFYTKLAKNDPQCQILPKKWARLAQNSSSLRYLHFHKFCM